MTPQTYSLVVDGITRTGAYRQDGPVVEHIALWLHGGTGDGPALLRNIPVRPGVLHVCPTELDPTHGQGAWVYPGLPKTDPLWSPKAPNDRTDLHFLEMSLEHFSDQHPDAALWAGGTSKGSLCLQAAYAWASEIGMPYFLGCRGLYFARAGCQHGPLVGWSMADRIAAGLVKPRSLLFLHGSDNTDTTARVHGGADYFEPSAQALAASVGVTLGAWVTGTPPTVEGHQLLRRSGVNGALKMGELHVVGGPHAPFVRDPSFNEFGRAMAFWFGSATP